MKPLDELLKKLKKKSVSLPSWMMPLGNEVIVYRGLHYARKFNPNHDPQNGQFTTAEGAGNTSHGEFQVASNDGTPGNNQAQNRQFRDAVRILKLTPEQAERLHREISDQNMGFHDILRTGRDMFDK